MSGRCGTNRGYQRHIAAREVACDPCREAHRLHAREARRRAGVPAQGPPKPCGTDAAYGRHVSSREVPCGPCTAAHAAAERARRGAVEQLVDATPVREHVARLRGDGLGLRQIGRLSGVSVGALVRLTRGDLHRGHGPSRRVHASTSAALLAVRPRLANLGARVGVDGTGTRRRLQALIWCGWTQVRIAGELGMSQQHLNQVIAQDRVGARTALDVRETYERLWNVPPPANTRWERGAVVRMRAMAAERGWAPPLAWDDDTIDDPTAAPAHDLVVDEREPGGRGPARRIRFEDIEFLLDTGCTIPAIAVRLGSTDKTIERYAGVVRARRRQTERETSDVA